MGWGVATTPIDTRTAVEQLALHGFKFFNPQIKTMVRRRGQRVKKLEPMFPNYMFVFVANAWAKLMDMRGISGMLMLNEGSPAYVPDHVIAEIRSRCDADGIYVQPKRDPFVSGQQIRVGAGAFLGFNGRFEEMRGEDRAIVLFRTLGRVNVPIGDLVAA